jgi:hypothetical protein
MKPARKPKTTGLTVAQIELVGQFDDYPSTFEQVVKIVLKYKTNKNKRRFVSTPRYMGGPDKMRIFGIVAILLTVGVHFSPRCDADEFSKQETDATKNHDPLSLCLDSADNGYENYQGAGNKSPHWYQSPEWVLVIVGGVTGCFIGWQAWETRKSVSLVLKKERARVQIELKPMDLRMNEDYSKIDFVFTVHEPTAAYSVESKCVVFETLASHINDSEVGEALLSPLYDLSKIIPPNKPVGAYAFLPHNEDRKDILQEIESGRMYVLVRGFIKYKDIFDKAHETRFRRYWRRSPYADDFNIGDWIQCGHPNENQET